MDAESLKAEVRALEERLDRLKSNKPEHDDTGTFQARVLELEDELAEKQRQLESVPGGSDSG